MSAMAFRLLHSQANTTRLFCSASKALLPHVASALRSQPQRVLPGTKCRNHLGVTMRAIHESTASSNRPLAESEAAPTWDIKMLYDGDCPLCMREVNMLRERDAGVGKICFVDISEPAYSPENNAGISFEQAMDTIHAILPDGKIVTNVEVFRRLYEAVGLGWIYAITRVEPIGKLADAVYGVWAKYRLPITGRPGLEVILKEKKTCK